LESVLPGVVGIALCLLGSALFSAAQAALSSLSESQARKLIESKGTYALKLWRKRPHLVQSGLLTANILANLGAAALSAHAALILASRSGEGPFEPLGLVALGVGVVAVLVLIFGQALPQAI